jgi:hypothetical protein
MLPAICPRCQAPGTHPIRIAARAPLESSDAPDAYYCDICAQAHNDEATRRVAWIAAGSLLLVALITTLALAWGTRNIEAQLLVPLVFSLALPWTLLKVGVWPAPDRSISLGEANDKTPVVICEDQKLSAILVEQGLPLSSQAAPGESFLRKHQASLLLTLVCITWFALIHSLGGVSVRVLVSGSDDAVLLVDSRVHQEISPGNSEDPRAGIFTRVLGGRRKFELLTKSGKPLGSRTVTIWPGRTYIVGHLPPGLCLFWERRDYGTGQQKSLLMPLGGDGPIWELRHSVDSWFVPLQADKTQATDAISEWESSGGVRRAIRLLPCRATL